MKHFAEFISFLFNPLALMFFLPYLVVFRETTSVTYALKWELFTSVFFGVIVVLFLIGKWRGFFSDYDISKREERPRLFFVVLTIAILYLLAAIFFKGILFSLSLITFGICVAILAFAIINYRFKASGHVGVATAFTVTMGTLFGAQTFFATVLIVPLVAWSRVFLHRHNVGEIIAGGFLGATIPALIVVIERYIHSYAT
jgi:hypothetical protein